MFQIRTFIVCSIAFVLLQFVSPSNFLEELKHSVVKPDNDCYAYADPQQLQILYEMEDNDRQLWERVKHFKPCKDTGSVMFNATAKDDYCRIHLHPSIIDSESLNKVAIGLKIDTLFRRLHSSQWCIRIHTWLSPAFIEYTHSLQTKRRRRERRSPTIVGLARSKQVFHEEWANHKVNHCPPVNNLNDGRMLCAPLNGTLTESLSGRDVSEMSEQDIRDLEYEIFNMITHERVTSHYRLNCDPFSFFYGHRSYLSCIRNQLYMKGIDLPIWNPLSGNVPPKLQAVKRSPFACLSSIQCHDGWLDVLFDEDIHFAIDLPSNLRPENICLNTFQQLYDTMFVLHHQIHAFVGGIFYSFDSPASLLFYFYHNWMDKHILNRWEHCSTFNMGMRRELINAMDL